MRSKLFSLSIFAKSSFIYLSALTTLLLYCAPAPAQPAEDPYGNNFGDNGPRESSYQDRDRNQNRRGPEGKTGHNQGQGKGQGQGHMRRRGQMGQMGGMGRRGQMGQMGHMNRESRGSQTENELNPPANI
ncbi:MAG: hypothetical protein R3C24_12065 [Cyanobacteriota/Melainabacteria group bacterium]